MYPTEDINDREDLLNLLLTNCAPPFVESHSRDSWTLLQGACVYNNSSVVKLLLDYQPNIYIEDQDGNTLLNLAFFRDDDKESEASVFDTLINEIPDYHTLLLKPNKSGKTSFDFALQNDEIPLNQKEQLIKRVLLENPSLEIPESVSEDPEMLDCWNHCKDTVTQLQEELNRSGNLICGKTPYQIITSTDPMALPKEVFGKIDINDLKEAIVNITVENDLPNYRAILNINLAYLKLIKCLKTYKLGDSTHYLHDFLQRPRYTTQLLKIFSDPKIKEEISRHLEKDTDDSPYLKHLKDIIKNNIEVSTSIDNVFSLLTPKGNTYSLLAEEDKNEANEANEANEIKFNPFEMLPKETVLEILNHLSVGELNNLSDKLTTEKSKIRIQEMKASPSTSKCHDVSLFKRSSSDSYPNSEGEPQSKKLRLT